ncbi:hypothetical protein [Piscinibacter gummiphilus]|uniref:Uncharacterized protein n=1 Tax=Piscinibacter gummiphilus TaxID=946333 RepID=A0A1W6L686_9BURK|nr:hypothetical protein [Piscinibacter gummiphilus]ARN19841.1 hypothetical protein A4W93_07900 [Piscinibacter gummiphilus]ATU64513.1 hypothetical protein CPZ87_07980 [Piscinibacter gummiphilus]GLS95078.1 hypothetical protein GCM10007918_23700 [Piscinibacter gummiphilus]
MTRRFGFADSEVAGVEVQGDTLRVRFAAANVSEPDTTTFSGERQGHVAGVVLVCRGGPWPAPGEQLIGRLVDGRVVAHGVGLAQLPLPAELAEASRVELHFANRARLDIAVTSVSLTVPHDAGLRESFAC